MRLPYTGYSQAFRLGKKRSFFYPWFIRKRALKTAFWKEK